MGINLIKGTTVTDAEWTDRNALHIFSKLFSLVIPGRGDKLNHLFQNLTTDNTPFK